MKRVLFFALAAVALSACEKEDHDHDHHDHGDSNDPIVIAFTSPTENQVYNFGDAVSVTGTISRASVIHGYTVEIINQSNQDSVLYTNNVHSHDSQLQFNDTWTHNLPDTSTVLIRVVALGDHEGTTSETLTRTVVCNGQ